MASAASHRPATVPPQAPTAAAPDRRRASAGRLAGALAGYGLLYLVWRLSRAEGELVDPLTYRAAFLLPGLLAAALAWQAGESAAESRSRLAWRLICASFLLSKAGNLLWLLEVAFPSLPSYSLASFGWVLAYPPLLAGLLAFPRPQPSRFERLLATLDMTVVLCGGGMLMLYLASSPQARQVGELTTEMTVFYPVAPLVLLAACVWLPLRRHGEPVRAAYALLGIAILLGLASDLAWGAAEETGAAGMVLLSNLATIASWLLNGAAAWVFVRRQRAAAPIGAATDSLATLGFLPLGFLLLGAVSALLAIDLASPGTLRLLVLGTLTLMALTLAAQWLAARHNAEIALAGQVLRTATVDPLTRLANRTTFAERLRAATDRALATATSFGIVIVDVNDVRAVNDAHGHATGDAAIVEIAERLRQLLPPSDLAARVGGDEFGLLLESATDAVAAARTAQAAAAAVTRPLMPLGIGPLHLTASIGVASFDPHRSDDDVLRRAYQALYHGKEEGKGRLVVHTPGLSPRALSRPRQEAELRGAIEGGELVLHYQPIVALRGGEAVGAEALVRWQHPERGLVAPNEFIELAETSGLIEPLGRWVLATACRQAAQWNQGARRLFVSVNLSIGELLADDIAFRVRSALADARLAPERLVLEITETQVARDPALVAARLRAIKQIGVRLAVDDFGNGYSSLGRLRELPIDILKVDRSFTRGLGSGDGDTVVRAIVRLGRELGLAVVGEGIEEAAEAEALLALGCELAQGYHFDRPMPADAFGRRLGLGVPLLAAAG